MYWNGAIASGVCVGVVVSVGGGHNAASLHGRLDNLGPSLILHFFTEGIISQKDSFTMS